MFSKWQSAFGTCHCPSSLSTTVFMFLFYLQQQPQEIQQPLQISCSSKDSQQNSKVHNERKAAITVA